MVTLVLAPLLYCFRLLSPDDAFFWIGFGAVYLQLGVLYGPFFGSIQRSTPSHLRGTTIALSILVMNLLGIGVGLLGTGILADILTASAGAHPLTTTLVAATVVGHTSLLFFWLAGSARPVLSTVR